MTGIRIVDKLKIKTPGYSVRYEIWVTFADENCSQSNEMRAFLKNKNIFGPSKIEFKLHKS